jgi:hypothetical protein
MLLGFAFLYTKAHAVPGADGSHPESAMTPTVSTVTVAPVSTDACATWLSDGDKAVGILVATDASCIQGGVGCIGLQCRYCRVRDTPQSSHYLQCGSPSGSTPPISPPSPASLALPPTSVDTCAKWSTPGDRAVGVSVFKDSACGSGGRGCIGGTTCRYCRVQDTEQSKQFPTCPGSTVASSPAGSDEACGRFSTAGDRAVGVLVASDATCGSGGTGCIGATCRFCRSTDTTQSHHLLPCDILSKESTTVVVASLSSTAEVAAGGIGGTTLYVAAAIAAAVAVVFGVLVVAVAKRKIPHNYKKALAAPMCIEHRTASLSNL